MCVYVLCVCVCVCVFVSTELMVTIVKHISNNLFIIQDEMEKLKAAGASQDEQDALLKQHEHNVNNLVGKLEADRMRMQSSLQERLKKRRQDKLQQKQQELKEEADQQLRQMENYQQRELERLKKDEVSCLGDGGMLFGLLGGFVWLCITVDGSEWRGKNARAKQSLYFGAYICVCMCV